MSGILIDILEDMIMDYASKLKISLYERTLDDGSYKTTHEKMFNDSPNVVDFFNTVLEAYASMGYASPVSINVLGTEISYSDKSYISIKDTKYE